jgi:ABC-type spermidine/putrescine transport system permease subunit I
VIGTAWLRRFAYGVLLLPALFITVGLFVGSLAPTFAFSFYTFVPPASVQPVFTLQNYAAFTHPVYLGYILVTTRISVVSTVVAMILGYPLAYTIARAKSARTRRALLFAVTTMFFVHTIVRAYAWIAVLGRNGPLSSLMQALGVGPLQLLSNEFAVTVGTIHWLLPFAIMTLIGPIQSVDPALQDASRNLGATELKTFTSVTLPLTFPGIAAASLLSLTLGFGMFVTPMILGGGLVTMLAKFIYEETIFSNNYPLGSAATMILLVLATVASVLVSRFFEARTKVR